MHFGRRLAAVGAAAVLVTSASALHADTACRVIQYQFQPLPYDAAHELPGNASADKGVFEEGGPQVAIWIEDAPPSGAPPAQRGTHRADLFITNRTAQFGIGNRPGHDDFVSSPRFPYGGRDNALPVWAFARGHSYPKLVMQDGDDFSFGFHESSSTSENFYCRPLQHREIVDALTCPTPLFNSDKGKFGPGTSLYPPRHDVAAASCHPPDNTTACPMLADLDDIAAVSGATPSPYTNTIFSGYWVVPLNIADGDYYIFIEVNKQYDNDAPTSCTPVPNCGPSPPQYNNGTDQSNPSPDCPAYAPLCDCNAHVCERHPSFYDTRLLEYALGGNFGQPSVVWAARIKVQSNGTDLAVVDQYTGYGDWDIARGNLYAPDASISSTPGSGAGRLKHITDADGTWQVKVSSRGSPDAASAPPPITNLSAEAQNGDLITVCFDESGVGNGPVAGYDIRYKLGDTMSDDDFAMAAAGPHVDAVGTGHHVCFPMGEHEGIQAQRTFTIGIRAIGDCMKESALTTTTITTPRQKFATVEGCFIATAAFGSDMQPDVLALRKFRDRFLMPAPLGRSLVRLYYGASPPLARAIRGSDTVRKGVRDLLRPEVEFAKAALLLSRP